MLPSGASLSAMKPYYRRLMGAAERLLRSGDVTPAVIMAFTACEVLVEQAFDELWRSRNLPELAAPVGRALGSNNLANERVRAVYNALSCDQIESQLFWPKFKEFAALRNSLVHGGERQVSAARGQAAFEAARAFQAYIVRRLYPYAMMPALPRPSRE